jgi:hypothetical protein
VLGDKDVEMHFAISSMNRFNLTKHATFSLFSVLGFYSSFATEQSIPEKAVMYKGSKMLISIQNTDSL